jgi:MoxR-like ATPase
VRARTTQIKQYIRLGPLGLAFDQSIPERRVVLLISEIDKADLEFPNDLLHELDAMRFRVSETGREVAAAARPIVVITSNAEKELPDAFLRRCVIHYIEFPDEALLGKTCRVHHPHIEDALLAAALHKFLQVRSIPDLKKRTSTSELIDWLAALKLAGVRVKKIEQGLPLPGVLLKQETDTQRAARLRAATARS